MDRSPLVMQMGSGREEASMELGTIDGRNSQAADAKGAVFPVKIKVPGMDPFEVQVSQQTSIHKVMQAVISRQDSCCRTCFSLHFGGSILDPQSELGAVVGLGPGAELKLVEELYALQDARAHVAHLMRLLRSQAAGDPYRQQACHSLSFLEEVLKGHGCEPNSPPVNGSRSKWPGSLPGSDLSDCVVPDYVLPGCKERPLLPLQPPSAESKAPPCLLSLIVSQWSPPPGNRKLHGDLLYLTVRTIEGRSVDITACARGFYVNRSSLDTFDPTMASPGLLSHSLSDLLSQLSPAFRRGFALIQKSRLPNHSLDKMEVPKQIYSWTSPRIAHSANWEPCSLGLGLEFHGSEQIRDWNEEFQTAQELPQTTLTARLLRDHSLFKVNSDFVLEATRGAVAAVEGSIIPINPSENPCLHVFLWKGIFLSLASDGAVGRAVPRLDLAGIQAYSGLLEMADRLHALATCIIDYRGYRVVAQALAPGVLERGVENRILYGCADSGHGTAASRKFIELLGQAAKPLRIQKHGVLLSSGKQISIYSSADCKGIVGNDGRYYILDLYHTYPPDLNFQPQNQERDGTSTGGLHEFPHQFYRLRPEVIKSFVQQKYTQFMRIVMEKMQDTADDGTKSSLEAGMCASSFKPAFHHIVTSFVPSFVVSDLPSCQPLMVVCIQPRNRIWIKRGKQLIRGHDSEPKGVDAVRVACKEVGSTSDIMFEIRFNPDINSPGVLFPDSEKEALQKQMALLRQAADFLVSEQIPSFITDCLHHRTVPVDGSTITAALHQRGINLRYMGRIAHLISESESKERLQHIYRLLICQMVTRSARRIFNLYLQGVNVSNLSAAVSHFLNCLLGSPPSSPNSESGESSGARKKKARRKGRSTAGSLDATAWTTLTPSELWAQLLQDAKETFHLTTHIGDRIDQVVLETGVQKVSLLRELCLKCGIQLLLREYSLDNQQTPPFNPEDIVNIFPVVKHLHFPTIDGTKMLCRAQASLQQGCLKTGYQQLQDALALFNRVYGFLHPDPCLCLQGLAKIAYIAGKYSEAVIMQKKAVIISERAWGFDHHNTINEYVYLALYCYADGAGAAALRLLGRARYLLLLVHGEDHPFTAIIDASNPRRILFFFLYQLVLGNHAYCLAGYCEQIQCSHSEYSQIHSKQAEHCSWRRSNIGLVVQGTQQTEMAIRFLQNALIINKKFHGSKTLLTALSYHLLAQACYNKGDFRSAVTHEREAYNIYQEQLGNGHERTKASSDFLHFATEQAVLLQRSYDQINRNGSCINIPPVQMAMPITESKLEQLGLINGLLYVTDIKTKQAHVNLQNAKETESISDLHEEVKQSTRDNKPDQELQVIWTDKGITGSEHGLEEVNKGDGENFKQDKSEKQGNCTRDHGSCVLEKTEKCSCAENSKSNPEKPGEVEEVCISKEILDESRKVGKSRPIDIGEDKKRNIIAYESENLGEDRREDSIDSFPRETPNSSKMNQKADGIKEIENNVKHNHDKTRPGEHGIDNVLNSKICKTESTGIKVAHYNRNKAQGVNENLEGAVKKELGTCQNAKVVIVAGHAKEQQDVDKRRAREVDSKDMSNGKEEQDKDSFEGNEIKEPRENGSTDSVTVLALDIQNREKRDPKMESPESVTRRGGNPNKVGPGVAGQNEGRPEEVQVIEDQNPKEDVLQTTKGEQGSDFKDPRELGGPFERKEKSKNTLKEGGWQETGQDRDGHLHEDEPEVSSENTPVNANTVLPEECRKYDPEVKGLEQTKENWNGRLEVMEENDASSGVQEIKGDVEKNNFKEGESKSAAQSGNVELMLDGQGGRTEVEDRNVKEEESKGVSSKKTVDTEMCIEGVAKERNLRTESVVDDMYRSWQTPQ
ncbi:clustered mitochondria protein homolog [Erpetoichthys calabaricus]|uniref:clustered mitochondria protein homolog n=1 Tax=Erpetoichthys calabaricus TaxID=27687 RepID=UPI0022347F17|nr:clustered mitochondria protein homolog [Erpetoichthys calabaricus]